MNLEVVAETGTQFLNFAPYVPAINGAGVVAFQAQVRADVPTTGVFSSDGREILVSPAIREFVSHPDINDAAQMCVYVVRESGQRALLCIDPSNAVSFPLPEHTMVGALGPTINQSGAIGFRGASCLSVLEANGPVTVASLNYGAHGPFAAFQGLPVVTERGGLVFFAEASDGAHSVNVVTKQDHRCMVRVRGQFPRFGYFPCVNEHGTVCFVAHTAEGYSVVLADDDTMVEVISPSAAFESIRGALIDDARRVLLFATPANGTLGVYTGPDPNRDRVFSIGDPLFGSELVEFALNPVSINARGDFAARLALRDGRGLIVRGVRSSL
jgi:hypothetical protein